MHGFFKQISHLKSNFWQVSSLAKATKAPSNVDWIALAQVLGSVSVDSNDIHGVLLERARKE